MRKIAICDNEPQDLENISQMTVDYLKRQSLDLTVETHCKGSSLLSALITAPEQYVLLLIDVFLGEENGVTLAKLLREQGIRSRLIFISISPDFALDGYKVNADDYLIKPFSAEDLELALDQIFSKNSIINIKTSTGIHMVQISDIRYIEADGHYVTVVTDTDQLRSRLTLTELETRLFHHSFIRCHKGFLVNLAHVNELTDIDLVMDINVLVPVGRQYHNELKSRLAEYASLQLPSLL